MKTLLPILLSTVLAASFTHAAPRRLALDGGPGPADIAVVTGPDGIDRVKTNLTGSLELFPATAKPAKGTVLLCPGGGYKILASGHEGTEVAKVLNGAGYDVAMLLYTIDAGAETRSLAQQDSWKALRLIRERGGEFGLATNRVGAMGFSAGGHLAARLAHEAGGVAAPDFFILIYPAYLLTGNAFAPEVVPTVKSPTFIFTSGDDKISNEGSKFYADQAKAAGRPCVLHMPATGGHGFGIKPNLPESVRDWTAKMCEFLKTDVEGAK